MSAGLELSAPADEMLFRAGDAFQLLAWFIPESRVPDLKDWFPKEASAVLRQQWHCADVPGNICTVTAGNNTIAPPNSYRETFGHVWWCEEVRRVS